jgi:ArsR family transcriptional regulator
MWFSARDMSDLLPIYKALADESRLRLLRALLQGRFNVNELVRIVAMGQSRVSRHLRLLLDAGLIVVQREGTWAYYEAAPSNGDTCVGAQLDLVRSHASELPHDDSDATRRLECLEQRRQRSSAFHERAAADWTLLRQELFANQSACARVLEVFNNVDCVADLGCGGGELLAGLCERSGHVIGVDGSPAMLDEARRRVALLESSQRMRVELRLGTLEHLPLANAEIDAALLNMVLHHIADPPAVLAEVRRALAPNGRVAVCDLAAHDDEEMRERHGDQWLGFSTEHMQRLLSQAGFAIESLEHYTEGPRSGVVFAVARPLNMGV